MVTWPSSQHTEHLCHTVASVDDHSINKTQSRYTTRVWLKLQGSNKATDYSDTSSAAETVHYYLCQVKDVNHEWHRYWFRSMCVCVRSGVINQTSLKPLKLRTSNLTRMFPGTIRTWPSKIFRTGLLFEKNFQGRAEAWPGSRDPLNFGVLNANSSKMVKATDFKFDKHVPKDSPDISFGCLLEAGPWLPSLLSYSPH